MEAEDSDSDPNENELNPNLQFGRLMVHSMRLLRLIFYVCGRLPVVFKQIEDGIYMFSYSYASPHMFYFILTSLIILFALFMGLFNVFLICFGLPLPRDINEQLPKGVWAGVKLRELVVMKRYLPIFVVYSTSLAQSAFTTIIVMQRREYFVNYFGFWTR
jgi:hypothetical protein